MKKRIIYVAAFVIAVASLSACGSKIKVSDETKTDAAKATQKAEENEEDNTEPDEEEPKETEEPEKTEEPEESEEPESNAIAGSYKLVMLDGEPAGDDIKMTLELEADGTAHMVDNPAEGSWTVDGSTITVMIGGDPTSGSIDGNKIILDQEGTEMVFEKE